MATAFNSQIHFSPKLGKHTVCRAKENCPFGDAHTTPLEIARDGGAEVNLRDATATQTISALEEGAFSIGTEKRTQVFREDGSKLDAVRARAWRQKVRKAAAVQSASTPTTTPPKKRAASSKHTDPSDFERAETSRNPAILAKLARHRDPAVRLTVAANPHAPIEVLEELALSEDSGHSLYRSAALGAVLERYQEMKDAKELAIQAQYEANPEVQKQLRKMPATRLLHGMPRRYWERKKAQARRYLLERAARELFGALGLKAEFAAWSKAKRTVVKVGKGGSMLVRVPLSALRARTPQKATRYLTHAAAHVSSGHTTGHTPQWRAHFRKINQRFGLFA